MYNVIVLGSAIVFNRSMLYPEIQSTKVLNSVLRSPAIALQYSTLIDIFFKLSPISKNCEISVIFVYNLFSSLYFTIYVYTLVI